MYSNVQPARGLRLCATPRRRHRADQQVFVVTTKPLGAPSPHMFGVHRPDRQDQYTSYILGFCQEEHARALATGLDNFFERFGEFPERDASSPDFAADDKDQFASASQRRLTRVQVESLPMSELLVKLQGTGIVLSVLAPADDGGPAVVFKWSNVRISATPCQIIGRLDRNWRLSRRDARELARIWARQPRGIKQAVITWCASMLAAQVACVVTVLMSR